MASEIDNSNNSLLRDQRKGKAAMEADYYDHDHDDRHCDHYFYDHHDYLGNELDETSLLQAQLALSYNNLDITLSQLPSASSQPSHLHTDYFNNRCSNTNDDDVLEKVKKKLTTLYAGQEKDDVILEWMEEIMKGLKEVREELTTLKKDIGCRPNTAA